MSSRTANQPAAHAAPVLETDAPAPDRGFAERLRDSTKAVHREAERTGFVADLIRGRATTTGYALFLRNLVPIYATLETALASLRHVPLVAPFAEPGLHRLAPLVEDLEQLAGDDWAHECALLPEAEAYARAIDVAAGRGAATLAAHAYARYLGDLSGGQILKPLLARTLGLTPEALRFYDFPAIPDLLVPKATMRRALDAVPADSPIADAIVDEAIEAFRHNIDLSLAVARAVG